MQGSSTSVLEFSGYLSRDEAHNEAKSMPGFQRMLGYNYKEATYVTQESNTREIVAATKKTLKAMNVFLLGRFAEWEYYNIDTAMNAALSCVEEASILVAK